MINNYEVDPIELDCASHNSVNDARAILEECKTRPYRGSYKIFILDECFVPDTEILTSDGFKKFVELDGTEQIAQYTDSGSIEFVKPVRYIKKHFEGELECWQPRRGHTIKMTPNHQQPLLYNKSGEIKSKSICNVKFAQSNSLLVSGRGVGSKHSLSNLDRLAIICQADGSVQYERDTYNRWLVGFKKARKIERFLSIINDCGIEYNEVTSTRKEYRRFTFNLPKSITKQLNTYFNLDFSYEGARDFINEIINWDGSIREGSFAYYSSVDKSNTDFVAAVGALGGYSAKQKVQVDNRKVSYNNVYRLWLYDLTIRNCQSLQKYRYKEYYNGDVYCVEVPTHKIVVRAEGYTFISGNCHMMSTEAFNALLKILEEPPDYVIFIFCTTDPQKVIKTILSRVQRFNFARISNNGIKGRLRYIIENENNERALAGIDTIRYEDGALDYIARLVKGGMRDSITTLEKCLDYDSNLTLENVLKVTSGGVTENNLTEFLCYMLNCQCKEALLYFNNIYMSGVDVSLFLKLWTEYLQNCVKYMITQTAEITTLSDFTTNWLNTIMQFTPQVKELLRSVLSIKTNFSADDLKIILESWIIEKCN